VPSWSRSLVHLIGHHVFEDAALFSGVEQVRLEASEGMIEDLHKRDVDFLHQWGTVGLNNIKKRVKHVLLYECCKKVVMKIWLFFTVRNLN
jgi:hypothetical protein